jgi:hypothetical protein
MFSKSFGKSCLKFANFLFKNKVSTIDPSVLGMKTGLSGSRDDQNKCDPPMINPGIFKQIETKEKFTEAENITTELKTYENCPENLIDDETTTRPDIIKNRVCEWHISANHPREDRSSSIQLKSIEGFFVSVFDGHRSDLVASIAKSDLHKKFDEGLTNLKYSQYLKEEEKKRIVQESLNYAFDNIVNYLINY